MTGAEQGRNRNPSDDSAAAGDDARQRQLRMLMRPETRDEVVNRTEARDEVEFSGLNEAQQAAAETGAHPAGETLEMPAAAGRYETSLNDPPAWNEPATTAETQPAGANELLQKLKAQHAQGATAARGTTGERGSRLLWIGIPVACAVLLLALGSLWLATSLQSDLIEVAVTSTPEGGTILLDGVSTGKATPDTISVAAGEHTLAVQQDGFETFQTSLTIEAGSGQQTTHADLVATDPADTGIQVAISSEPPGAEIVVDGNYMNQQTPATVSLQPGSYQLELKKDGFDIAGKQLTVAADMQPLSFTMAKEFKTGVVTIETDPPGATVEIDGEKQQGITPLEVTLTHGKHQLLATLDSHDPRARTLYLVEPARTVDLALRKTVVESAAEVKLAKLKVNITSAPPGALIEIDGVRTGKKTPAELELEPQLYNIALALEGFEVHSGPLQVNESQLEFHQKLEPRSATLLTDATVRDLPDYLDDSKKLLVGEAIRKMLGEAWDMGTFHGTALAREQYGYAKELCNVDLEPRIPLAYGLVLYRHRQMKLALAEFDRAADAGRKNGYFAPSRLAIRVRLNLGGEHGRVLADCVDLVRHANQASKQPGVDRAVLTHNLRFAGAIVAFLQGPKAVETRGRLAFNARLQQLRAELNDDDWYYFEDAMTELDQSFQQQLQVAAVQKEADVLREKARIESGRIPTSEIEALEHNFQEATAGSSRGGGYFMWDDVRPWWAARANGPVVSRSYAHGNRTDTFKRTTQTRYRTFTMPRHHRPYVLMTYLPTGLDTIREELVSTFPEKYQIGQRRYD